MAPGAEPSPISQIHIQSAAGVPVFCNELDVCVHRIYTVHRVRSLQVRHWVRYSPPLKNVSGRGDGAVEVRGLS